MSATVWYEQVDTALIKLIKRAFGDNINIRFRSPDDFNDSKPPYVGITHLKEKFDRKRYDETPIRVSRQNNTITLEEAAKPYNLEIQVDIVTDSITDMNRMSMLWQNTVIDRHNLDVLDMSGNPHNCYMRLVAKNTNSEQSSNEDRSFINSYVYRIRVEIDECKVYECPMVTDIIIN